MWQAPRWLQHIIILVMYNLLPSGALLWKAADYRTYKSFAIMLIVIVVLLQIMFWFHVWWYESIRKAGAKAINN